MDWQFAIFIILAQTAGFMLLIGVLFHILTGALRYPVPRKTDAPLPKPSPSAALKHKTAALIAEDRRLLKNHWLWQQFLSGR